MARQFRSDDSSPWIEGFGNSSDGTKTVSTNETYDGARASCSGSSGSTSLTLGSASSFANGDLVLIHQTRGTGVGGWELNKIISGGGGTSLTLAFTLQNTYTDSGSSQAQIVEMKQYNSLTVNNSTTFSAPDWDGDTGGIIAFFVKNTATITGTISASSTGYRGGTGSSQGVTQGASGEGTSGASASQASPNGNGGGGSEGTSANLHGGGGGGYGAAGSDGSAGNTGTPGGGGSSVGVAGLTSLMLGGGGGAAGAKNESGRSGGAGGDGGGIVLVIAKNLTVTGSIVTNGANGSAGSAGDGAGGGGGAGGAVLLKGHALTLGSTLVTATAGTGAGPSGTGGNGGVGRIHADYRDSISGTTSPTIDSRQDLTLQDTAGGMFLFSMI